MLMVWLPCVRRNNFPFLQNQRIQLTTSRDLPPETSSAYLIRDILAVIRAVSTETREDSTANRDSDGMPPRESAPPYP